jgi:hypothetical protein
MNFETLLLGHRDERCISRISETLDRMDPRSRLWTVLSIKRRDLGVVWELFEGQELDANQLVPQGTEPLHEVIHHGKNSLPLFRDFQKRFVLADDGSGELWGYNHQLFGWATGPGYFVAHPPTGPGDEPSHFVVDYTRLPASQVSGWPTLVPNSARLGRFVFRGMQDYLRRVSSHTSIGRAYRNGKPSDNWFILCRDEPRLDG